MTLAYNANHSRLLRSQEGENGKKVFEGNHWACSRLSRHALSLPCSFNNRALPDYTAFDRSARAFSMARLFCLSHANMAVIVMTVSGIVIAK
jgi:hypothetical protein